MCSGWQQCDAGSNQPFWSFSRRASAEDSWPREFVNVYDIHVGVMSGFPLTLLTIAGRVLSQQTKQPSPLSTLQLQPSIMRQLAMAWRVRLEFWCRAASGAASAILNRRRLVKASTLKICNHDTDLEQALQDVAVACRGTCALVLHRQGQRLTNCALTQKPTGQPVGRLEVQCPLGLLVKEK